MAHLFQEHEGYASPKRSPRSRMMLGLPLAVVESTISFYTLFFRKPVGEYMLQVCRGLSCVINGAEEIMAHFREQPRHRTPADDRRRRVLVRRGRVSGGLRPCSLHASELRFKYDLTPQNVDDMLAAMRGGTVRRQAAAADEGTRDVVEGRARGRRKSAGGVGVSNPNNAGGVGDRSGVIMLDRVLADPSFAARSHERLVRETNLRPTSGDAGHH